jgi:uncharacterized protein (TIGR02118 family)
MIRVLILYPRKENCRFDYDYYRNRHLPLVKEKLRPVRLEIDRGEEGGRPAPFLAVTHMVFNSREELKLKYAEFGKELNADKDRFTDIEIVTQISEIAGD